MKKVLAIIIALTACCALAACSEKYPADTTTPQTSASQTSTPAPSKPVDTPAKDAFTPTPSESAAIQPPASLAPAATKMPATAEGGIRGDSEQTIVGTWKLIAMEDNGVYIDLTRLEELDITGFIVLTADNKASMTFMDETYEDGSWEAKGISGATITFEGEPQDATIADGKLTMELDGAKIIFAKDAYL